MLFICGLIIFIPLGTVQYLFKAFFSLDMIYTAPYIIKSFPKSFTNIEVFVQEHNGFHQYVIEAHHNYLLLASPTTPPPTMGATLVICIGPKIP